MSTWLRRLAVPVVLSVTAFLGFSSQLLFHRLDPPLTSSDSWTFNVQLACLLCCYARACLLDPGFTPVARTSSPAATKQCRKCGALRHDRVHHCRVCGRCVLKMDHHCPWTANCVGYRTMPSFCRFLFFAVSAMSQLAYLLWLRLRILWTNRHLPYYLGPSVSQLAHLFILAAANSLLLFLLLVLLLRTLWSLATNVTAIEELQIEKHATDLRRARRRSEFLTAADGSAAQLELHHFPYDIGIWENITQAMASKNPLLWLWPLAPAPLHEHEIVFKTNGFNPPHFIWPPPSLDRQFKREIPQPSDPFTYSSPNFDPQEVAAFRRRQQQDLRRWESLPQERGDPDARVTHSSQSSSEAIISASSGQINVAGSQHVRINSDGHIVETGEYSDEDLPLAVLQARRKDQ